jgi:hypothetical protein
MKPTEGMSIAPSAAYVLLCVGLLSLAGCGTREPAEGWSVEPRVPTADEFTQHGLLPIGQTRDELRARLGEPLELRSTTVPNRHVEGVTDTLFEVVYPGLVVNIHRPGAVEGEFVSHVDVEDNRYLRFPAVGIGTTRDALERALGPPHERSENEYVYLCETCLGADEPVIFYFEDDRVRRIRFTYYVG